MVLIPIVSVAAVGPTPAGCSRSTVSVVGVSDDKITSAGEVGGILQKRFMEENGQDV